jgi:hypothetical protein
VGGGGSFLVLPIERTGRVDYNVCKVNSALIMIVLYNSEFLGFLYASLLSVFRIWIRFRWLNNLMASWIGNSIHTSDLRIRTRFRILTIFYQSFKCMSENVQYFIKLNSLLPINLKLIFHWRTKNALKVIYCMTSRIWYVIQNYGSADPDPIPTEIFMDPKHCFLRIRCFLLVIVEKRYIV